MSLTTPAPPQQPDGTCWVCGKPMGDEGFPYGPRGKAHAECIDWSCFEFQLHGEIDELRRQLGALRTAVKEAIATGLWLVAARAKWPADGATTMLEWRTRRERLEGLVRAALRK